MIASRLAACIAGRDFIANIFEAGVEFAPISRGLGGTNDVGNRNQELPFHFDVGSRCGACDRTA